MKREADGVKPLPQDANAAHRAATKHVLGEWNLYFAEWNRLSIDPR
jgi:hypothetical protein